MVKLAILQDTVKHRKLGCIENERCHAMRGASVSATDAQTTDVAGMQIEGHETLFLSSP